MSLFVMPWRSEASGGLRSLRLETLWLILVGMRPSQWVKNALVAVPAMLTVGTAWFLSRPSTWERPVLGVIATMAVFSAIAGALYLVNDVRDAEADRHHPTKQRRPVAAGRLAPATAVAAAVGLFLVALPLAFAIDRTVGYVAAAYAALALGYSLGLKQVPYLELAVVAVGFGLRLRAGAEAAALDVPFWLDLSVMYGAFVLVAGKRRAEIISLGAAAVSHRAVLRRYAVDTLDILVLLAATGAVVAFAVLAVAWSGSASAPDGGVVPSVIPFMAVGLLRYIQLLSRGWGGNPIRVFRMDRPLQAIVIACAGTVLLLSVTVGA